MVTNVHYLLLIRKTTTIHVLIFHLCFSNICFLFSHENSSIVRCFISGLLLLLYTYLGYLAKGKRNHHQHQQHNDIKEKVFVLSRVVK